jgi:hypothetical protein
MSDDLAPQPPPADPEQPADRDQAADAASRRPLVERVGMAAIAAVMALLFAAVAALSFGSGEPFLGVMAAIGTLMTAWVGLLTLVRG